MKRTLLISAAGLALFGAVLLAGCSDTTNPESGGVGTIKLNLVDAPGDYDQVNVEVVRVDVHRGDDAADANSGWYTIAVDTTYVDLLTLTDGQSVVLADSTLPAGYYTQVRLILGARNTVMVDSVLYDLEIPSSMNTGLKLNHPFTIAAGAIHEATLDFDADRSIHLTGSGQYKMKPVIRIVVNQTSGGIEGTVEPVAARARVWTVAGQDTVTAYADTLSGMFSFRMLPAGSYDLNIGATAGAFVDTVIQGVAVEAAMVTDIGTVVLEAE